jgi:hypothetical protein
MFLNQDCYLLVTLRKKSIQTRSEVKSRYGHGSGPYKKENLDSEPCPDPSGLGRTGSIVGKFRLTSGHAIFVVGNVNFPRKSLVGHPIAFFEKLFCWKIYSVTHYSTHFHALKRYVEGKNRVLRNHELSPRCKRYSMLN